MSELIQFFIETAGISGDHLAGMLVAGVVVLIILCISAYHIIGLIVDFFKYFKPIKFNKVQKIDKVVEVPKYVDSPKEYKEILATLKRIENKQGEVKL